MLHRYTNGGNGGLVFLIKEIKLLLGVARLLIDGRYNDIETSD